MTAEFFKDDNGFIWLFYAKDIYMRQITKDLTKM